AKKWMPRIVILGLAIGFSLATALWSFMVVLVAFAFMLYLAPGRRKTASLVLLGSLVIGVGVDLFFAGLTGAAWPGVHSMITPHVSMDLVRNLEVVFADGYTDLNGFLL